ncbi:chaperonin 10-like protein [Lipomyces japonicus]|uniref:chaperonin 10-like protein n=1 Tax=Lipomyces japonicus TaxID=56871 RepID=UPI0034CD564F
MATIKSIRFPKYTKPSGFVLIDVPKPAITNQNEILIKVHAASINPVDVKLAAGFLRIIGSPEFPAALGYDVSGVVEAIGDDVKDFKIGDAVYSRVPQAYLGTFQEYVVTNEETTSLKPSNISFEEAAAVPLVTLTALQALERAPESIKGKTVYVNGGLSGTGSAAIQLAKNVFGASKVISTVSTVKVDQLPKVLGEGLVDEIIDYKKQYPPKVLPDRSIDFVFDTVAEAFPLLHAVKEGGYIATIALPPSGDAIASAMGLKLNWLLQKIINGVFNVYNYRASRWGVNYGSIILESRKGELRRITQWIEEGKFKPVVGKIVPIDDFEQVKNAFSQVYDAKGLTGKTVIKFA